MGITSKHLQCFMPRDGGDLHGIQALLEEPGRGLVTEIVKGQPFDPRLMAGLGEIVRDCIGSKPPHLPVDPSWNVGEDPKGFL